MNALKRFALVRYIGADINGSAGVPAKINGTVTIVQGFTRDEDDDLCIIGTAIAAGWEAPIWKVRSVQVLSDSEVQAHFDAEDAMASADMESEFAVNRSLGVNVL